MQSQTNETHPGNLEMRARRSIRMAVFAGGLTVGAGTKFNVTGSYTQSRGTTTVDGTLTAPSGTTINAGRVFGKGTVASTVVSSGSVTAGDSLLRAGKLSMTTYTQNATPATLNIQLGGTTVGTQYSQLAVANGASLDGTLNVTLINNFVPGVGATFAILTSSVRSGTFSTVNLPTLTGAHFQINYSATSVTLTVANG